MGQDSLQDYLERSKFWIKVTKLEYYDTWQVTRVRMNFVVHSQAENQKVAYQFYAWSRNYKSDFELSKQKLEVIDFLQKNQDPWDRIKTNRAWSADSFESGSCQLYAQGDVDIKKTENLFRLRMVIYLDVSSMEDFSFWVKTPEPLRPFTVSGSVTKIANLYGGNPF